MDKEFFNRIKSGEQEAITEFINSYRNRIYVVAYRIAYNKEDALDITQDVFIKVLKNLDKFVNENMFDAYIHRMTANCAYDYLRARFKPDRFNDILMFFTKRQRTPAEHFKREELRAKILTAVNKLTRRERDIIIMKYFNELKINEIAEALNVTDGTIKKMISRSKEKLEKILRKEIR